MAESAALLKYLAGLGDMAEALVESASAGRGERHESPLVGRSAHDSWNLCMLSGGTFHEHQEHLRSGRRAAAM